MRGYKATEPDMTCKGFRYELGKTYTIDGDTEMCKRGFHFCKNISDIFEFYDRFDSRFFEVEADGVIEGHEKNVAKTIRLIRELEKKEVNRVIYSNGYGNGWGYGYGNGYSNGCSNGDCYGNGWGYGYGGEGDGWGEGDGNGDGNGNGWGCGWGSDEGCGYGYGSGYGSDEYGRGCGDGYGWGHGGGYGYGSGYDEDITKTLIFKEEE